MLSMLPSNSLVFCLSADHQWSEYCGHATIQLPGDNDRHVSTLPTSGHNLVPFGTCMETTARSCTLLSTDSVVSTVLTTTSRMQWPTTSSMCFTGTLWMIHPSPTRVLPSLTWAPRYDTSLFDSHFSIPGALLYISHDSMRHHFWHTHTHTHIPTHIHMYTHAYTRTHTQAPHTHTHTHTHIRTGECKI